VPAWPFGASCHIDELASVFPLVDGLIRTALDTEWGMPNKHIFLALISCYLLCINIGILVSIGVLNLAMS
jgi:hypothetical protein